MDKDIQKEKNNRDIETNRDIAAFSYFLILSPVILLTRKDSPFIQFHARQACMLFVMFIIIAFFPRPVSYLNFLMLALTITGFFQANLGNRWKIPIIAQLIEAGFSVDVVGRFFTRIYDVIRRSFIKGDRLPPLNKEAKTAIHQAESGELEPLKALLMREQAFRNAQETRLLEAETELIILRYLSGKPLSEVSPEAREQLAAFVRKLQPFYVERENRSESGIAQIYEGKHDMPRMLIGGFDDELFTLFVLAPFGSEIRFGEYGGKTLRYDDENEQEKLLREIKELGSTRVKIAPYFRATGQE